MPNYDEYSSLWEGNSPNAVHAYKRMEAAGQAPDNSWLERLFSRQRPAPAPVVTDEGRFPEQAPSPFVAPPPQAKPVSKLSSAADLGTRIRQIVQQPWQGEGDTASFEPIRRTQQAWQGEGDTGEAAPQGDPLAMAVNQYQAEEPPLPRIPIDMREQPSPFTSASLAGLPSSVKQAITDLLSGGNRFGGNKFGGQRFGGAEYGGNRFGGNRFGASAGPGETGGEPMMEPPGTGGIFPPTSDEGRGLMAREGESDRDMRRIMKMVQMLERLGATNETGGTPGDMLPAAAAQYGGNRFGGNTYGGNVFGGNQFGGRRFGASKAAGGEVPGYMRGGYPELRTAPIRHQFDSGGQSYVDGDSDGRADDIDARLSAGEYVVDSETLGLLGNGNPKAGAKKMDQFRSNIRKHKGAALAKGKISPNAKKNPAEYLAGNPMGDGMRRLGKGK